MDFDHNPHVVEICDGHSASFFFRGSSEGEKARTLLAHSLYTDSKDEEIVRVLDVLRSGFVSIDRRE